MLVITDLCYSIVEVNCLLLSFKMLEWTLSLSLSLSCGRGQIEFANMLFCVTIRDEIILFATKGS
jgi:hypothetical protein